MENLISCRLEDFIFSKQIHPFVSIFDIEPQTCNSYFSIRPVFALIFPTYLPESQI